MDDSEKLLSALKPGSVLDLATGSGEFALRLAACLGSYGEILAVDSQPKAVAQATQRLAETRGARVMEADASALPFAEGSFDLVSVANSLHHFRSPGKVLAEALRVLAPGGHLVVHEMHRDADDEASMSHVLLHHWWAAIDSLVGTVHNETYGRAGLKALVEGLGLGDVTWLEIPGAEEDVHDQEMVDYIGGVIDSYGKRIPEGHGEAAALLARGEELRQRVKVHGFRSAPSLLFIGARA